MRFQFLPSIFFILVVSGFCFADDLDGPGGPDGLGGLGRPAFGSKIGDGEGLGGKPAAEPAFAKKLIVTLTDEAGKPVHGVPFFVESPGTSRREIFADEKGRVVIPLGLEDYPTCSFSSAHGEWWLPRKEWTFGEKGAPAVGNEAAISVVLHPAGRIGGIVRGPDGTPIAGAGVLVEAIDGKDQYSLNLITTDENGRWNIAGVPRSGVVLALLISHPGNRTLYLRLGANSQPSLAELFAQKGDCRLAPPRRVHGVITAAGQPVAHARVSLCPLGGPAERQAETDQNGQFELSTEREGQTTLTVTATGYAPSVQRVPLGPDEHGLVIAIDAGHALKGRILTAPGAGLAHTTVVFEGVKNVIGQPSLNEPPVIGTTDDQGRFTWAHAPRTRVACTVLRPDGQPFHFEWDTSRDDDLEVPLKP